MAEGVGAARSGGPPESGPRKMGTSTISEKNVGSGASPHFPGEASAGVIFTFWVFLFAALALMAGVVLAGPYVSLRGTEDRLASIQRVKLKCSSHPSN